MPRFLLLVAMLLFFVSGSLVFAEPEEAGYASVVRGEVYAISPGGVARTLKAKSAIYVGDHIVTEAGGRINVVFRDSSVLSLGQKSRGQLTRYGWSEISQQGEFELTVREGVFRVIGDKLTRTSPEKFKTVTPAATIGIRGSGYAGQVAGDQLEVMLTSGKGIDVGNAMGSVALLTPGLGTKVISGRAPATPRMLSPEEINALLSQLEEATDPHRSVDGGGSSVSGTVVNRVDVRNSTNVAAGKNNSASLGAIQISDSSVEGTVVNQAEISNSSNIAVGSDNEAATGSIIIE